MTKTDAGFMRTLIYHARLAENEELADRETTTLEGRLMGLRPHNNG
ncbi:MAG TPA: hypothetical protein VIE66_14600 [Methylocella sp.]|jgi:hypothetical protein